MWGDNCTSSSAYRLPLSPVYVDGEDWVVAQRRVSKGAPVFVHGRTIRFAGQMYRGCGIQLPLDARDVGLLEEFTDSEEEAKDNDDNNDDNNGHDPNNTSDSTVSAKC